LAQSRLAKLQVDYDAQCAESEQLRLALLERDSIIAGLRQNQEAFPTSRLSSEIASFRDLVQGTAQKLADAQALKRKDRQSLESTIERFSSIAELDNAKQKVTQFFDELQNFCQFLTAQAIGVASRDESELQTTTAILHESEVQKLRAQHQLHRVQRQLDEASAENSVLSEQLKNDRFMVAQLASKVFPDSLIYEDDTFVRKEVTRLETFCEESKRTIRSLRVKTAEAQSILAEHSGKHDLPFTGDLVADLRTALDSAATATDSHSATLKRLSTAVHSFAPTVDSILGEVEKLSQIEALYNDTRSIVADLKQENAELKGQLDALRRVSSENAALSDQLQRQKRTLAESQAEITHLSDTVSKLSAQCKVQMADKSTSEQIIAATSTELAETRTELQISRSQYSELSENHTRMQTELDKLTELIAARDAELRKKTPAVKKLSRQLESANDRVSELVGKLDAAERENAALKTAEARMKSLIREIGGYRDEVQEQAIQITTLKHENEELEQSLADVRSAYETNRQRLAETKAKALDCETTIDRLNNDNARLRAIAEESQAELNHSAQGLRSQLTTAEQSLSDSAQRVSQLQRSLTEARDQFKQATNRNLELTEQIGALSTEREGMQSSLDLLTRDNGRLLEISGRYDALRASSRAAEKHSKVCTKSLAVAREESMALSSRIAELESRIGDFEDTNKSLSTELDSQAAIADDAAAENEKLQSKVHSLSSKLSAAKVALVSSSAELDRQSAAMKDLTRCLESAEREKGALEVEIDTQSITIRNLESELRDRGDRLAKRELEVSRLTTANRDLQDQFETANASSAMLESKEAIITDLNYQLRHFRNSNESLTSRNSKLERELRESAAIIETNKSELQEQEEKTLSRTAVLQRLRDENSELALKISALEDGRRDAAAAADGNRALRTELETVRKENRQLNRTIRKLSAQIEALQRESETGPDLQAVVAQKDVLITQLRELTESQGLTIGRLRKTIERAQDSEDIAVFLNDIEQALAEFDIGGVEKSGDDHVRDRLQAIWILIQKIREMFEDQKHSLERMSNLTTSQHNVIMKLSRNSFEQRSPR
jgi:chromosome segregation ATPase